MTDKESCENCKYHGSHRDGWNLCLRRAPVILPQLTGEDSTMSVWPETNLSDWCGKWEGVSPVAWWYLGPTSEKTD